MTQIAQRSLTLTNELGLHVRSAVKLIKLASQFDTEISFSNGLKTIHEKSVLELLTLGISCGDTLTIKATGAQSSEALEAISQLILNQFLEEEKNEAA